MSQGELGGDEACLEFPRVSGSQPTDGAGIRVDMPVSANARRQRCPGVGVCGLP